MASEKKIFEVIIVGGLGHVGLPLGLVFAQKGLKTCLLDIDKDKVNLVKKGIMPFVEYGAEPILKEVLRNGNLELSFEKSDISKAKNIIITIGTGIDKYLAPETGRFMKGILEIEEYLDSQQTLIIRSTVYPTTTRKIQKVLEKRGKNFSNISYCPERIIQGYALQELIRLPQIVSGSNEIAINNASDLFSNISPKIINVSFEEAELIKLFSNALRYIQFATANQFYILSKKLGADYENIRKSMMDGYERVHSLPSAGFSAGPCLLKDTMQLVAFDDANFPLGYSAMAINEGIPNFIVEELKKKYNLNKTKIGILGMAFKGNIDDIRDSLSCKLAKLFRFEGSEVYCSDEFAKNPSYISKEELIRKSDIVIIGAPHSAYRGISFPNNTEVIDLWGIVK